MMRRENGRFVIEMSDEEVFELFATMSEEQIEAAIAALLARGELRKVRACSAGDLSGYAVQVLQ